MDKIPKERLHILSYYPCRIILLYPWLQMQPGEITGYQLLSFPAVQENTNDDCQRCNPGYSGTNQDRRTIPGFGCIHCPRPAHLQERTFICSIPSHFITRIPASGWFMAGNIFPVYRCCSIILILQRHTILCCCHFNMVDNCFFVGCLICDKNHIFRCFHLAEQPIHGAETGIW